MNDKERYPEVAIIMLNWNTPDMTISAVETVLKSDYRNFKIHLTDNGSKDNSFQEFIEKLGNRISVYQIDKNRGYVGGMNYCLEQAAKTNPHYFMIMNNDTILDPKAISSFVTTAQKYDDKCVVTGKVFFYDRPNIIQTVGNNFNERTMNESRIGYEQEDLGQFNKEAEREMIDDVFMLFPKKIYDKIGGYSTYFYLNYEQTDLILRIKKAGNKIIYTPDAKLWHKGSFSTGGLGNPYMMFWEGKSIIIIHVLYQSSVDFIVFYFNYFSKLVWQLVKEIIKVILGRKNKLKAAIAKTRGFWSGTVWLLNKKVEKGYNPYED